MKRTINNKVYNTETATLVAEYWNHLSRSDFHYLAEDLYLTPKGVWFLHGQGGAMTHHAEHYGNSCSSGESIIPMTEKEALEWCQDHGAQKAIDQHFSRLIEEA